MMVGVLVLPEVMVGITEASTTRRPSRPKTRSRASTTAVGSDGRPILAVPIGGEMVGADVAGGFCTRALVVPDPGAGQVLFRPVGFQRRLLHQAARDADRIG